jgi:hypothetical protein
MKKFTESQAVSIFNSGGGEVSGKRLIIKRDVGLKGLAACSAMDYLLNHCGYVGV